MTQRSQKTVSPPQIAPSHTFRVGDRVRFLFGTTTLRGIIVEDRGAIGVGGRRLLRVQFSFLAEEPMFIEIPEDELEVASAK